MSSVRLVRRNLVKNWTLWTGEAICPKGQFDLVHGRTTEQWRTKKAVRLFQWGVQFGLKRGSGRNKPQFFGKIPVDIFAVTIRALDPADIFGDLQKHTGMPQCAFAAVTGHTVAVHDLGFWRFNGHRWRSSG